MTKRDVIRTVLDGGRPPYVPWQFGFTQEARARLATHFGTADLEPFLQNHLLLLDEELWAAGLSGFNPFQPEVMDVFGLLDQYRGRLAFLGGLSTQRTLPFGTPDDVRREARRLLAAGRAGGYIFAPAHAVAGDVPVENMLAFIAEATAQADLGPTAD
jgi:hypothetical protein